MSKLRISAPIKPVSQVLYYGTERISYQVVFSTQQKNKVKISVLPNGIVQVISPESATLFSTKQAVQKRARWIYEHLLKIRKQQSYVLPREYVSGECHFYLGRRYVLKVIPVKRLKPGVKLYRGQIQVRTRSRKPEVIKILLNDWYREQANKVFSRRLHTLVSTIRWLKVTPAFSLRTMKKQWGSCSPKGKIILNPKLVKASRDCIDYVIAHELCHIKEHNHSQSYYKLLNRTFINWEETKTKLDGISELLLSD